MQTTQVLGLKKIELSDVADITVINENWDIIESEVGSLSTLIDAMDDYSSYASSVDSNGIYTVVEYKRADSSLVIKTTLSGGTSPNYTTMTVEYYDTDGTTVTQTKTWTFTYDANGKVVNKVVS